MGILLRCAMYLALCSGAVTGLCCWRSFWVQAPILDSLSLPRHYQKWKQAEAELARTEQRFQQQKKHSRAVITILSDWQEGRSTLTEAVARLQNTPQPHTLRLHMSLNGIAETNPSRGLARLLLFWAELGGDPAYTPTESLRPIAALRSEVAAFLQATGSQQKEAVNTLPADTEDR